MASGINSAAIGFSATSLGANSAALGVDSKSTGTNSLSVGAFSKALDQVRAVGDSSTAKRIQALHLALKLHQARAALLLSWASIRMAIHYRTPVTRASSNTIAIGYQANASSFDSTNDVALETDPLP